MKKIFILLTLMLTSAIYAQTITPIGSLRLTMIGSEINRVECYGSVSPMGSIKTDLTLGANITKFFTASTRIETYCLNEGDGVWFTPYQSNYYISFEAHYKSVKLGVEHACYHPVEENIGITDIKGGYSRAYFEVGF